MLIRFVALDSSPPRSPLLSVVHLFCSMSVSEAIYNTVLISPLFWKKKRLSCAR
jgi:hypothetical protein